MVQQTLSVLKAKYGFFLTLLSVIGLFGLAYFKDVDISSTLPMVLGIFIIGRAFTSIGHSYVASKDEACDTKNVIDKLEENS